MKRFVLVSPKNRTVYNFRGDLIKEIIRKDYEVIVTGPDQTDVEKIKALGARFNIRSNHASMAQLRPNGQG